MNKRRRAHGNASAPRRAGSSEWGARRPGERDGHGGVQGQRRHQVIPLQQPDLPAAPAYRPQQLHRGYDVVEDATDTGCPEFFSWGVEDRCMIDQVIKFIDRDSPKKQPFFVFSWTQGTHHPYGPDAGTPSPGWDNPDLLLDPKTYGNMYWDLGRYMCALYELDKQIARLFVALRERGLARCSASLAR